MAQTVYKCAEENQKTRGGVKYNLRGLLGDRMSALCHWPSV